MKYKPIIKVKAEKNYINRNVVEREYSKTVKN